ncbi:MAG: sterol desaturase family protein [bacterium]
MNPGHSSASAPHFIPEIFLRRFSHPWKPMALFIPLALLLTWLSLSAHPRSIGSVVLWIALGVFAWTLIEYFLHRHVFHLTQIKEPWRSMASGLHLAHHKTVDTADLIIAPPISSLTFGTLVYFVFALFTFSFSAAALLETGVLIGYLFYEWCHYGAHRFQINSRIGKYLKQYHLRHHFKEPHRAYGVTSPLWDMVFRTLPKK